MSNSSKSWHNNYRVIKDFSISLLVWKVNIYNTFLSELIDNGLMLALSIIDLGPILLKKKNI